MVYMAEINEIIVLGVDVGGTGIKSALVNLENGELVSERIAIETPKPASPNGIFDVMSTVCEQLNWKGPIGCGFPAVVKNGVTLTAANVSPEWIGFDALQVLRKMTPGKVGIVNDADAAGLAEMRFGAGKPYYREGGGTVLMITLGTGIGSGLFVEGHLHPNTELGHIEIDGYDAEDRAATVVREKERLSWPEWGARVNRYFQTLEFLLNPDVFIVGGGVSAASEKFFPYIHVKTRLLAAQLHNDAGIIGAALAVGWCDRQ